MDTVTNVVSWISNPNSRALPAVVTPMTMDLDRKAWTVQLEYLTSTMASVTLDELFGPPDSSVPFVQRRWSFAGARVTQRGRRVTVTELF